MNAGQMIGGPQGAAPQDEPEDLRAALLRMTPEERAAMFEPYGQELDILNAQAQPQAHTTAGGALFAGLGNMFANMDRREALKRMQADMAARTQARYGLGGPAASMTSPALTDMYSAPAGPSAADRAAMVAALRKQYPAVMAPGPEEEDAGNATGLPFALPY